MYPCASTTPIERLYVDAVTIASAYCGSPPPRCAGGEQSTHQAVSHRLTRVLQPRLPPFCNFVQAGRTMSATALRPTMEPQFTTRLRSFNLRLPSFQYDARLAKLYSLSLLISIAYLLFGCVLLVDSS